VTGPPGRDWTLRDCRVEYLLKFTVCAVLQDLAVQDEGGCRLDAVLEAEDHPCQCNILCDVVVSHPFIPVDEKAAEARAACAELFEASVVITCPFTFPWRDWIADETGDGVILIWDAVGSDGNVTITSSDGSATTANSVGGENAGRKQVINVTRTITTNDLLAGVITIPIPFTPTGFNINAVDSSGTPY